MRLVILGAMASLLARSSAAAQTPVAATREVRNALPAAAAVEQFVITPDSQRTYYRPNTGGVWMYDRNTNATSQIMTRWCGTSPCRRRRMPSPCEAAIPARAACHSCPLRSDRPALGQGAEGEHTG
jgi:hypothetical protein